MLCVDEHRTFSFGGKRDLAPQYRLCNEGERNSRAKGKSNLDIKTFAPEEKGRVCVVSQMKLAGTNTQSVISAGARQRDGDGSRKWV